MANEVEYNESRKAALAFLPTLNDSDLLYFRGQIDRIFKTRPALNAQSPIHRLEDFEEPAREESKFYICDM